MSATRIKETWLEPEMTGARGGRRPRAAPCAGTVLRIVSTDARSVRDFQELVRTTTRYELLRQERGRDDWGRRTYTHVLRRKA